MSFLHKYSSVPSLSIFLLLYAACRKSGEVGTGLAACVAPKTSDLLYCWVSSCLVAYRSFIRYVSADFLSDKLIDTLGSSDGVIRSEAVFAHIVHT